MLLFAICADRDSRIHFEVIKLGVVVHNTSGYNGNTGGVGRVGSVGRFGNNSDVFASW